MDFPCHIDNEDLDTEDIIMIGKEEALQKKSTAAAIRRHRDERYKRRVEKKIRSLYPFLCRKHIDAGGKRYERWLLMKTAGWRLHERRGWYDQAFIKKLYNSRVRRSKVIANGNHYRKMRRKSRSGEIDEY